MLVCILLCGLSWFVIVMLSPVLLYVELCSTWMKCGGVIKGTTKPAKGTYYLSLIRYVVMW